jgi:hypothetical protein
MKHMNAHTYHYVSRILLDQFERLGLERPFESLTIKELNELAKNLVEEINKKENAMDEPPF